MTNSSSKQPLASVCISAVHRPRPGVVVVDLTGELDMATTPSVAACLARLASHGVEHLILDLTAVSFMASSGVGMLVDVLDQDGIGSVRLVGVRDNDHVRRVIDVSGLRSVFPDHVSVDDALA